MKLGYCVWALLACAVGLAQQAPPVTGKTLSAKEIMQKTLAAYSAAKTYQGSWTYTLEQGEGASHQIQKMQIEIKSKAPNRLSFHLSPAPDQKPQLAGQALPELLVILDGKTAWFENTSESGHFAPASIHSRRVSISAGESAFFPGGIASSPVPATAE